MTFISLCKKLHIFRQCYEYNIRLGECPSFLFVIIGFINIVATVSTYFIATRFTQNPEPVILITFTVTILIFIIGYSITKGFEKLAQANQMKTEFVSVASHQLRTPLSSIRWVVELLTSGRLGRLTSKQLDYLNDIKQSNKKMVRLINDILDVSRIEMGKLNLQPEQVDILEIIQELIKEFEPLAKASNVKIFLKSEPNLPLVYMDPQRITMAIQNILDNAIKYIKGKGEVGINLVPINKNFAKITISDTGVGIPENQKKFIFQRFFRSNNILKHQTVGTGLGLFIAKAIVETSGGKIGFKSKENIGSTFWFTVPVVRNVGQGKI